MNPGLSIKKVVLSISKIPLNVVRGSIATRVNDQGKIENVPANTPRFNYDPLTLEPLGLLIEPESENLIAISNINSWSKTRVTVTATNSLFADQISLLQGNGAAGQHNILTQYLTVSTNTYRTLSINMKNATNRFAQISVGSDAIFANLDLELGLLDTKRRTSSRVLRRQGMVGIGARCHSARPSGYLSLNIRRRLQMLLGHKEIRSRVQSFFVSPSLN